MKSHFLFVLACFLAVQGHCTSPSLRVAPADTVKVASFRMAAERLRVSRTDSAVQYAKQGIALAARVGDDKGQALLLQQLGSIYATHGNNDLAERYYLLSLPIFTKLNADASEAEVHRALGNVQSRRGHFKEAVRQLQQSVQIYQQIKDTSGEIRTQLALGRTFETANRFAEAIVAYDRADDLNRARPFSLLTLRILQQKGAYYERTGDFSKALGFFREGIRESGNNGNDTFNINLSNKAGAAAIKLGDSTSAMEYYRYGLDKAKSSGLPEEQVHSLLNMADILKESFAQEGLHHLHDALDLARKAGDRKLVAAVYKSMASIYRQQNDYKEALHALEQHHRLMDSVLLASKARETEGLRHLYELDQYKMKVQQREFQRNIGRVVIAALILLIIVIFINYLSTRSLNKQLTQSNKIKDILFSILGHDMRGPMGTVEQGLTITEDMSEEELRSFIPLLTKNVQTVNGIVNSLFEWSKTQQKNFQIQPERFDPTPIIQNNALLLEGQATAKSIDIQIDIPGSIRVSADPNQFGVIVRNLLSNAIKFSHEGGSVSISATTKDQRVTFAVADQGVGIPAARVANFFRELVVTFGTKGEKGTGIGLQLTKEFVAANKGEIWVESSDGSGSTFFFSLPEAI